MEPLFPGEPRPLIFGHRGYASLAPENTMESFQLCADRGVFGIELDVHLCKSGELVVIHDHNVERIAGIPGHVESSTFAELRSINAGIHFSDKFSGATIPLLEEVFNAFGTSFHYDIELKQESIRNTGLALKTWNLIQSYHLEGVCMISSFNPFAIRQFNRVSSHSLPTGTIYSESPEIPRFLQHGWGRHISQCTIMKPDVSLITPKTIGHFKSTLQYPIIGWTIDNQDTARQMIDWGIDGIITNNPGIFMESENHL